MCVYLHAQKYARISAQKNVQIFAQNLDDTLDLVISN
jgi:hypothetical protein